MSVITIISLLILNINSILSNYLEVDSNYRNPRAERNNIVNKGTWVRTYKDASDKTTGNFLFRGNAIDADNIIHADFNQFNAFGDTNSGSLPFISSYVERNKRAADVIVRPKVKRPMKKKEMSLQDEKTQPLSILNTLSKAADRRRRFRKSLNNCKTKDCTQNNVVEENASLVKSKLINKLKPASVFNDYPYEIAMLLSNKGDLDEAKNYSSYIINEMNNLENSNQTVVPLTENKSNVSNKIDIIVDDYKDINQTTNSSTPKRSMNNFKSDMIKRIVYNDVVNKTKDAHISFSDRNVFAKEDKAWHQNAPIPDTINRFKILGKGEEPKVVRPVTERGLIKVLSMLTNTFKKIMKQHNEIKDIHKKLHTMNEDFVKNVEVISDRFQDFETKYSSLVNVNQKLVEIESKINAREQHFKTKERELSKNLVEFEIQQKKFLTQQRQFYNIQKLMLAQNERINAKQNAIAKTQSEISHRQNNFARILKKAKQVYFDSKHTDPKETTTFNKIENNSEPKNDDVEVTHTTTIRPQTTEPVKINLFSIPTVTRLQNQDHLLLNGKEEQPVDELVYKYYFNNTLIDTLMKNFLSGFLSNGENNDSLRNVKNKRDEIVDQTTILLPVNKSEFDNDENGKTLTRERRWINHHSRKKWRHKNRGKGPLDNIADDGKPIRINKVNENNFIESELFPTGVKDYGKTKVEGIEKSDPFVTMATGFCKGIGQNSTPQMLDWCVEKALRKLKNIDIIMPPPPPSMVSRYDFARKEHKLHKKLTDDKEIIPGTSKPIITKPVIKNANVLNTTQVTTTPLPSNTPINPYKSDLKDLNMFFPDNEKLESNLKQYELIPDTEGNFYYDGSLHASGVIKDDGNSDSDLLPSLDSSSRIDTMDPETFDTQAMRRAFLRRMKYESMLNKITKL